MVVTKRFWIAACMICSMALTACEQDIGRWAPIKITVNGNRCKSSEFDVPANGGEYRIYSKNYGSLWLNAVEEDGKTVWPENFDWTDFYNINLVSEWYEVRYDETGNIVVKVQSKDTGTPSRSLTFDVEAGDAFGYLTLKQY